MSDTREEQVLGAGRSPADRDLFTLASATMSELLDAVATADATTDADGSAAPSRAAQLANLIVAEAVRLIRLGATADLAEEAARLGRSTSGRRGAALQERDPAVRERLHAAAIVLGAAASPASRGGELAVLRSAKGKARELTGLVASAPNRAVSRAELRDRLGLSESHLSHLLADLEDAGLVVRIRHGRTVMVHLGPKGDAEHVRELLPHVGRAPESERRTRQAPQPVSENRFLRSGRSGRPICGFDAPKHLRVA